MIAIIPAKTTSARCPNKNWRPFAGTTLVQLAINCAKSAGLPYLVVADSGYRGRTPVLIRPDDLPDDSWAVVDWALQDSEEKTVVLLQPTSPLRTSQFVSACVAMTAAFTLARAGLAPALTSWNNGPTGTIYIRKRGDYMNDGIRIPDPRPFDIDTEADFDKAEKLFEKELV